MTDNSIRNSNTNYILNHILRLIIDFCDIFKFIYVHMWEDILDIVSFLFRSFSLNFKKILCSIRNSVFS